MSTYKVYLDGYGFFKCENLNTNVVFCIASYEYDMWLDMHEEECGRLITTDESEELMEKYEEWYTEVK